MRTLTGLDVVVGNGFAPLLGRKVGLVCNQASIARDFKHAIDHILPLHREGMLRIEALLGSQHGLWGHTQDNMIEWEGAHDPRTGIRVYSLYGENRSPTAEMLDGIELLVIDLPDVGARYYTFIWTMALCMKACQMVAIPILLLDRPNPISGRQVEGTVLESGWESFVGMHPLPTRHGMTLGEIAMLLQREEYRDVELEVVQVRNWERSQYFEETGLPWAMPSPNMPSVDTAVVYPGGCLLEGTLLSEGRGTTRPFEIVGAAGIDGWKLGSALNELSLPGVLFRPIQFQPTFQKFAGQLCEGVFVHVTNRQEFRPFLTYVAIIRECVRLYPDIFGWRPPPYEYEETRMPFDILAGNGWLRTSIENLDPLTLIEEGCNQELSAFEPARSSCLFYGNA